MSARDVAFTLMALGQLTGCRGKRYSATEILAEAVGEIVRLQTALEIADRRLRDVAARNGGPMWLEAKQMLHGDLYLIHDGIYKALTKETK